MFIGSTVKNMALASAVNNRIKADGSMIAAKATLWRLSGVGLLCLLAGIGAGAAFYGYSYVLDSRSSAEQMATAFADALKHADFGTVRLNAESAVRLEPSASVKLEPATVKLEAGSTVRIAGDIPRPTERQLSGGVEANTKVVTNYTIFKDVSYGEGSVITGWIFGTSQQDRPQSQFCYYAVKGDDRTSIHLELAQDGKLLPPSRGSKIDIDTAKAAQQCIWFLS